MTVHSQYDISWLTTREASIVGLLDNPLRLLLSISDGTVIFNNCRLPEADQRRVHLVARPVYLRLGRGLAARVDRIGVRLAAVARVDGRGQVLVGGVEAAKGDVFIL